MAQEVRPAFSKMRTVYGLHLENAPSAHLPKKERIAPNKDFKPLIRSFSWWETNYDLIILCGTLGFVGFLTKMLVVILSQ